MKTILIILSFLLFIPPALGEQRVEEINGELYLFLPLTACNLTTNAQGEKLRTGCEINHKLYADQVCEDITLSEDSEQGSVFFFPATACDITTDQKEWKCKLEEKVAKNLCRFIKTENQ